MRDFARNLLLFELYIAPSFYLSKRPLDSGEDAPIPVVKIVDNNRV